MGVGKGNGSKAEDGPASWREFEHDVSGRARRAAAGRCLEGAQRCLAHLGTSREVPLGTG